MHNKYFLVVSFCFFRGLSGILQPCSAAPVSVPERLLEQSKVHQTAGKSAFARGNLEQGKIDYLSAVELLKKSDLAERRQHSGYSTRISSQIWTCRTLLTDAANHYAKAKKFTEAQKLASMSIELGSRFSTPIGPAPYTPEYEALAASQCGLRDYGGALATYHTLENIYSTIYERNEKRQVEVIRKRAEILALTNKPREAAAEKKRADTLWNSLHSSAEELKAACRKGDLAAATRLVQEGASANGDGKASERDWHSRLQPIHYAVLSKNKNLVAYLLDKGADINNQFAFVDEKYTDGLGSTVGFEPSPLHLAVYQNDVEMARYLISRGARVNVRVSRLDVGPPINTICPSEDATPLHYAARNGNQLMVKVLLRAHADKRALDADKKTPLDWAKDLATSAFL